MPLKRQRFTVYLNDPDTDVGYTEVETEVTFADQLRGEKEAHKNKVDPELQLATTVVMLWCALVREEKYVKDFQTFRNVDLLDMEKHRDVVVEVDPTQPAVPSGLSSPSLTGSQESPSTAGSPPTTD